MNSSCKTGVSKTPAMQNFSSTVDFEREKKPCVKLVNTEDTSPVTILRMYRGWIHTCVLAFTCAWLVDSISQKTSQKSLDKVIGFSIVKNRPNLQSKHDRALKQLSREVFCSRDREDIASNTRPVFVEENAFYWPYWLAKNISLVLEAPPTNACSNEKTSDGNFQAIGVGVLLGSRESGRTVIKEVYVEPLDQSETLTQHSQGRNDHFYTAIQRLLYEDEHWRRAAAVLGLKVVGWTYFFKKKSCVSTLAQGVPLGAREVVILMEFAERQKDEKIILVPVDASNLNGFQSQAYELSKYAISLIGTNKLEKSFHQGSPFSGTKTSCIQQRRKTVSNRRQRRHTNEEQDESFFIRLKHKTNENKEKEFHHVGEFLNTLKTRLLTQHMDSILHNFPPFFFDKNESAKHNWTPTFRKWHTHNIIKNVENVIETMQNCGISNEARSITRLMSDLNLLTNISRLMTKETFEKVIGLILKNGCEVDPNQRRFLISTLKNFAADLKSQVQ